MSQLEEVKEKKEENKTEVYGEGPAQSEVIVW